MEKRPDPEPAPSGIPTGALAHVLWIGGPPDSGKTTISRIIAAQYGLQLYNYDRHDLRHMEHLAEGIPGYRDFLTASMDERWVHPSPEDLARRVLSGFRDRLPLVIEDLLALPHSPLILAEGFGLTPELLAPVLPSRDRALWLVPTPEFKRASMTRRNKPSFRDQTSDPARATENLFRRDLLLSEHIMTQAQVRGFCVLIVDGSRSVKELAARAAGHFSPFPR